MTLDRAPGAPPGMPAPAFNSGGGFSPLRAEVDVHDCVVEGKIPDSLSGAFYATGPDPQYPMRPGNIVFDGEGHVRMFRIRNSRVDYRTRFARTERWVAQDKARRSLMPMYRNPSMDDPSVKGLSRSTANTHVINHRNMILALKEDSPPCAMDLNTLETIDPVYTFDGQLPRDQPFTAHPKVCPKTGNIVAFGYEAKGFGSDVVSVFGIDGKGKKVWNAEIKVPYVGLLHDFAITENYILIYIVPLAIDHEQMRRGGIHRSWDKDRKTYLGFFRRYGDGKDLKWAEGPTRSRYGFAACPDPNEPDRARAGACYARMDNQTRTFKLWNAGNRVSLAEPVFAPKSLTSREGEGYLMGVAYHLDQALRSDLVILDAEHLEDGPIAIVKLPTQASPQVHGWWVREDQFPA